MLRARRTRKNRRLRLRRYPIQGGSNQRKSGGSITRNPAEGAPAPEVAIKNHKKIKSGKPRHRFPKGNIANPTGRPKGAKNRVGTTLREVIAAFVENNVAGAQALYDRVAKRNPAKALDLLAKFAEFVLPKLNRTEVKLPSSPASSAPITSAEEASRVYAQMMGDTSIDLSAITFQPVVPAPQPLGSEWDVVAEQPPARETAPTGESNVIHLADRGAEMSASVIKFGAFIGRTMAQMAQLAAFGALLACRIHSKLHCELQFAALFVAIFAGAGS